MKWQKIYNRNPTPQWIKYNSPYFWLNVPYKKVCTSCFPHLVCLGEITADTHSWMTSTKEHPPYQCWLIEHYIFQHLIFTEHITQSSKDMQISHTKQHTFKIQIFQNVIRTLPSHPPNTFSTRHYNRIIRAPSISKRWDQSQNQFCRSVVKTTKKSLDIKSQQVVWTTQNTVQIFNKIPDIFNVWQTYHSCGLGYIPFKLQHFGINMALNSSSTTPWDYIRFKWQHLGLC